VGTFFKIKGDLGAVRLLVQTSCLKGSDVNEHIGAAIVRLNEPEAFGGVDPLTVPVANFVSLPSQRQSHNRPDALVRL